MSKVSSADYQEAVSRVAASLQDCRLAVLAGAGISIGRSSNLPSWSKLVFGMLDALRPASTRAAGEFFVDGEGLLLNEVVLKVLDELIGREATISALRACFSTSAFSAIHNCLAQMAMRYDCTVVTTNYDLLVEASMPAPVLDEKVIHAHGTLEAPDEMRFTEANVFSELPEQLRARVRGAVDGRCLLVCGYRGADEFDVMPAIFRFDKRPRTVIWIYHSEEPDAQVMEWIDGVDTIVLGADVDNFLADVWRVLDPSIENAASLADVFAATESPNPPEWWRSKIEGWGREILQSDGRAATLVWPTILERFSPKTPKAATAIISAYEDVLAQLSDTPDVDSIQEQMLPWLAIAGRIGSKELHAAAERLRESCKRKGQVQARDQLAGRLGAVLHEYGRALYKERRFDESDQALMEAWRVRSSAKHPEAAYSIFQVFMHARGRFSAGGDWNNLRVPFDLASLDEKLEAAQSTFLERGEPRHAATMVHNRAFLKEFRGKNQLEMEAEESGVTLVRSAKVLYEDAAKVRRSLRAAQLHHRSLLRLAECELWLLQHDAGMSDDECSGALARSRARLSELKEEGDVDEQIRGELSRVREEYDSLLEGDP